MTSKTASQLLQLNLKGSIRSSSPHRLHQGGRKQKQINEFIKIEHENKCLYNKMNHIELRNLPSFSYNERKGDHIILAPIRKKADRLRQLANENAKILAKL